jgi:hypothetical protein
VSDYHPLRERERALLEQHGEEWLRPIRALARLPEDPQPGGWRGWFRRSRPRPLWRAEFRRGFVEVLDLEPAAFLRCADALVRLTPLRRLGLDLRDAPDCTGALRDVVACPHLAGLQRLALFTHRLGPDEMRRLVECPHLAGLRELHLGCDGMDWRAVEALTQSGLVRRLTELWLARFGEGDNAWTDLVLEAPAVRGLTALSVLSSERAPDLLGRLSRSAPFARLAELALHRLRAGDRARLDGFFNWLPATLTRLDLQGMGLGDRAMAALAQFPRLRQLTRLGLSSNNVADVGALTLADSPHLCAATQLDMRGNPLSERVKNALRIRLGHQVQV